MKVDRRTVLRAAMALTVAPTRAPGAAVEPRAPVRFRDLREPVQVPLAELAEPWASVRFKAFCPLPEPIATSPPYRLLRGLALRLPAAGDAPSRLEALCVTCPHEICEVDLRRDTAGVPFDDAGAVAPRRPLFVCACHWSVFDPTRAGERLAGPAPRGLYRFESRVDGERFVIVAVEAAALR
jgi:Rieske Fe-S protein